MSENTIWTEKYRPTTLENYIGNTHIKEKIQQCINNNDVPNLLLFGNPGTGKSTICKILTNSIDCDYLWINASDENNVDTIRNKVKSFASTMGFKTWKIVVLDECLDETTPVVILRNGKEQLIQIKDLNEKLDLVKSFNFKKNKIEWRPFNLWNKGEQDVYEIEFENNSTIICTGVHKWYVYNDVNEVIRVKTKDLHNYSEIISPI